MTGKGLLKFSSIFMAIWGIFNLVTGIILIVNFELASSIAPNIKEELSLAATSTFLVVGIAECLSAWFGFAACKDQKKAKYCFVFSTISILLTIAVIFFGDTSKIEWSSTIASLFIPILYFFGALLRVANKNKKINE